MEANGARDLWASFQHDPRDPAFAPLRASDADRDVVHRLLADAFADGRLDREEHDERSASVLAARTLGQLPPLVADLVPDRPLLPASGRVPLVAASSADLHGRAEEQWRDDRRNAFFGFVGSAVVTWAIWFATSWGDGEFDPYFMWPLIVNAFALLNLVRTAAGRRELVAQEVRRLERKQAKAIEARRKKRPGGSGASS